MVGILDLHNDGIKVASYNMHGFKSGEPMLNSLCNDLYDVIFVQEHWLLPANVALLRNFNVQYGAFGISGVCDIAEYAQKGGRPYGGVGVLWKQNSLVKCSVLGHDDLHRCIAIKLECDQFVLICVNVYLPTYTNSDYYEEDILSCVSYIDSVFSMYVDQQAKFAVIVDFNFDCDRLLNCDRLCVMRNLVQEYNLINCDELDCNRLSYTYRNSSLNVNSLIDHESFLCNIRIISVI